MDPDQLLRDLRTLSAQLLSDTDPPEHDGQAAIDLAQKVQELDAWLMRGGFQPAPWSAAAALARATGSLLEPETSASLTAGMHG